MKTEKFHTFCSGLFLTALGIFFALYAYLNYNIGSLSAMGPGFFPFFSGSLLSVLGCIIAIQSAFIKSSVAINVKWKNLFWVSSSILVFSLCIDNLGLLLSTSVAVFLSTVPLTMKYQTRLFLTLLIVAITYLIFELGLGMTLPIWPNVGV